MKILKEFKFGNVFMWNVLNQIFLCEYDAYKFYEEIALDPTAEKWFIDNDILYKPNFIDAVNKLSPYNNVLYDILKIQN